MKLNILLIMVMLQIIFSILGMIILSLVFVIGKRFFGKIYNYLLIKMSIYMQYVFTYDLFQWIVVNSFEWCQSGLFETQPEKYLKFFWKSIIEPFESESIFRTFRWYKQYITFLFHINRFLHYEMDKSFITFKGIALS